MWCKEVEGESLQDRKVKPIMFNHFQYLSKSLSNLQSTEKNLCIWGLTIGMEALASVKGSVFRGKKDIRWCNFSWLTSPPHRTLLTKSSGLLRLHRCWNQRCPNWSRSHSCHFIPELLFSTADPYYTQCNEQFILNALSNQRTSDAPWLLSRYHCTLQLQNEMQMIQNTCRSTWLVPLSMKTKEAKYREDFLLFRMTVVMHSPNIVQNSSIL